MDVQGFSRILGIITAVEISSKIRDLCIQLAELDPEAYYDTCRADDDSADWQKRLDEDLTEQQREEAIKFGRIMSQCFETSGQECACEEIPFPAFADACSEAAPLAVACDIEGDEAACEALDDLEMPNLPDHLQDVFDELENIEEARYDLHLPRECEEAGATTPRECSKIIIETNAPEECKQALLDSGCENERECRTICEEIMFELHDPDDCKEEGLTPEECGEKFRDGYDRNRGPDCGRIEDNAKRLECYDGKLEDYRDEDRYRETKERERQCAMSCAEQDKPWFFHNGECECGDSPHYEDYKEYYEDKYDCTIIDCLPGHYCDPYRGCVSDEYDDEDFGYQDCAPGQYYNEERGCYDDDSEDFNVESNPDYDSTRGGDGTSCASGYESDGQGGCIPFGTGDYGFDDPDSDSYSSDYDEPNNFPPEESSNDDSESSDSDSSSDSEPSDSGSPDSGEGDSGGDEEGGDEAPITGSAISDVTGNGFLDYFFRYF